MIQKEKADLNGLGKEKMMFTAIRSSYVYLESLKNAPLDCVEWGFDAVCSDKNKFGRNTVVKDVGLPG
ncbi:hypothetical protein ABXS75_18265 [Roseburia hominis]